MLQTHIHNMKYLLLFYAKNGFVNASQCYRYTSLPVLFVCSLSVLSEEFDILTTNVID